MVKEKISADIRAALKSADKPRTTTLRWIMAAIKQQEIDRRKELSETETFTVLTKLVKQRREAMALYKENQRADLYEKEKAELELISAYLPKPLSEAEVTQIIDRVFSEQNPSGMRDIGKIIKILKPLLHGRADFGAACAKVRAKLSA